MSRLVLAVAALAHTACEGPLRNPDKWSPWDVTTCGDVSFNAPTWTGEVADAYEPCGLRGTSGSFIEADRGLGWLTLSYEHRDNDLSWLPDMWLLTFDLETFGSEAELGGFGGSACMLEVGECTDTAWLTDATVTVLGYGEDDTGDPYYEVEWEVVFGDPESDQPWYASTGHDWVYWGFHEYWDGG